MYVDRKLNKFVTILDFDFKILNYFIVKWL